MIADAVCAWPLSAQAIATALPWMPRSAALHDLAIDRLMQISLFVLLALCIVAQVLIFAGMFLRPESKPRFNSAWRWAACVAVVAFFVWMTVAAERLWATLRLTRAQQNAVSVEVTGVQFQWYFRYPGPDETYGRTSPKLIDAPGGNPLGIDPADPHSTDDFVSSVLVLPLGRQVDLHLRALDVIHGFYVPAMRVMQNATPGTTSEIHFTPTRTGDYPIVCSQLCGLGHYRMRAVLRVVSAEEFAEWTRRRETARLSALAEK